MISAASSCATSTAGGCCRVDPMQGPNSDGCRVDGAGLRYAHAPSVSRPGAKRVDRFAPSPMRGMTRRKAQQGRLAMVGCRYRASPPRNLPLGASSRRQAKGPFVAGRHGPSARHPAGLRPPSPAPRPADKRQGLITSPDGDPDLPRPCRCTTAGAASCSTSREPSGRPLMSKVRGI
jgi:hypothetical protein